MAEALLGLGGNLGEVRGAITTALDRLAARGIRLRARSSFYRTPPWGKTDQPDFINAVAFIETELAPEALLDACLAIEADLGRVRHERWGARTIDIDLLAYDDERCNSDRLTLPHPRLFERGFVLIPMAEIVPNRRILGRRIADEAVRFAHEPIVRLD